ncbi:phage protease [Shewanella sp. SW36]|uniref:phage protease n=1 Tax=unclassified Shewanella TaxID=196818 RepID=UPI0021D9F72B|nr:MULTISPECIES: phage protease [unclassified Shewanella]MCU7976918.1 phage protease [Shewanella sp. SW36]MCU7992158.1 phage protease [Shewanella sp. SW1]MCU8053932.1 phage protease [Shewanella sp. SM43]
MPATTTALGFAALSSQLNVNPEAAFVVGEDGYIQALPDGHFAAVDGRPDDVAGGKWLMDSVAFAALQANTPHKAGDLVIDYEHQTLNKEKNGQPAPAAGWFNIDDVQYRQGQGLFIKPRFTDNAIAYLTAKEYKYFSLVFGYDTSTGRPQFIHSAALTNRPGVDGMLPLASLAALAALNTSLNPHEPIQSTDTEELHVNSLLKKILAALGVEIPDDVTALTAEQEVAALSALNTLTTAANSADGLKQQLTALSATSPSVDLSQYVPVATVAALRAQLVALTAENGVLTVEQTVKAAIDEGKAFECERDYLTKLGKQSMAALTANLGERVAIAALTAKQTTTVPDPIKDKETKLAALTADHIKMADSWGMSHADFAKAIAADQEQK